MSIFRTIIMSISVLFLIVGSVVSTAAKLGIEYADQQKLHQIVKKVSAINIERDITKLVNFGTRHTLSETKSKTRGIGAARRWIKTEFDKISSKCGGCLKVYFQKETISGERR
ncbi:MAG: hypothetical protein L3J46_06355, partial [Kangiellaceae bacterium]|nr:hypothetical protein [Kangiellaceae bacterium]